MRKAIALFAFGLGFTAMGPALAAGPAGFASLDGGTPGGDPQTVCSVATADEQSLRDAVDCTRKSPRGGVVTFAQPSRPITLSRRIELPSNITVRGPVTLQSDASGMFHIAGARNVVVTDIVFRTLSGGTSKKGRPCPDPTAPDTVAVGNDDNPGTTACTVPITIQGTRAHKGKAPEDATDSKNVWIDHNTFARCGDKCITIKNGAKKQNGQFSGADNVTVSNNKFQDSFFALLITLVHNKEGGARYLVMRDTGKCERTFKGGALPRMRVSVYGNLFDHVRRRMVRAAYCSSYVHEFNNAIVGFGLPLSSFGKGASCRTAGAYGFGPSAHSGGKLYLENNYIAAWPNDPRGCKQAIVSADGEGDEGYIKDTGNLYVNGAQGGSNKPEMVAPPPYSYTALPAAQVYDSVTKNAGARTRP